MRNPHIESTEIRPPVRRRGTWRRNLTAIASLTPDGPDLIPTGLTGQLWREAQEPPDSPQTSKDELQILGHEVARRLSAILGRRGAR